MANSSNLQSRTRNAALALAITAVLAACGGSDNRNNNPVQTPAVGDTLAVTTNNRLINFSRSTGGVQSSVNITGLTAGDVLVGFDIRPANNTLVAVANTGRIYSIDPSSGAATALSVINPAPALALFTAATSFGVDFNPVPDALRITTNTGQNLRVTNLTTGATVADMPLMINGALALNVVGAGYNNKHRAACRTQLFYLDVTNNRLLTTAAPNAGVLSVVGPLGVTTNSNRTGFEFFTNAMGVSTASVVLTVGGIPTVFSLNPATGAATAGVPIMGLSPGENVVGISATTPTTVTQVPGELAGVTASNRVVTFERAAPTKLCSGPMAITGLDANTTIVGIDSRPNNNQLYALGKVGTAGKVYVIDPVSGAVNTTAGLAPVPLTGATLPGTTFGVDFNPATDLLRVVDDTGQNLSVNLNVTPGMAVATVQTAAMNATPLVPPVTAATPVLVGAGYTNSIGPLNPASTTLYTVDASVDGGILNIQNPAASGVQTLQAPLGLPAGSAIREFDVNGANNTAVVVTQAMGATTSTLFNVTLAGPMAGTTVASGPALATSTIGTSAPPTPLAETVNVISFRASPQQTLFGVTAANNLVTFGTTAATAATFASSVAITGLQGGEKIVGIDFRPANGLLYAASDAGRVFTVNTATGALTATAPFVANSMLVPPEVPFLSALLLPGSATNTFGVDFNPMADRLRTVATDNQLNLRTVIETGVTFVDTGLSKVVTGPALGAFSVTSAAYSGSSPGTPAPTATTLYVIDTSNDRLFVQNPPNDGVLNPYNAVLGVDATATGGFDIVGRTTALAALTVGGVNNLYSINLATGAATLVGAGAIGTGADAVTGLAITPSATDPAAGTAFGVTAVLNGTALANFQSNNPGTVATINITGLAATETVRDIDFRPATGALYAFGTLGGVYIIDPLSGVATPQAALMAGTPAATGGAFVGLTGLNFGIDFNPVPDRLRIVSDAGQSLRIAVDTGATFMDRALTTTAPATAAAAAYTNNFATPLSTVLFQIDTNSGTLEVQDPLPNMGMLTQRGRLDPVLTFTKVASFDLQGADTSNVVVNNAATTAAGPVSLAVLQPTGALQSTLYRVNLSGTGFALTPIGPIGPSATPTLITSFAIRLQ